MKRSLEVVVAGVLLLFVTQAMAEGLREIPYTNLQFTYMRTNFDDSNANAVGYGMGGSFCFGDHFLISELFEKIKTDTDITKLKFGVELSYILHLNSTINLVSTFSIIHEKYSHIESALVRDTGYSAGATYKVLANQYLEIDGAIDYTKLFKDGVTSYSVVLVAYPHKKLGIGVSCYVNDDASTFGAFTKLLL